MALALEEVAHRSVTDGGDPFIRFWRWDRRAVTIGSFQNLDDEVYADRCEEEGIPIIRRISGGGTMYHEPHGEFVFSLTAPPGILSRDIPESYRQVLDPVRKGLKSLGIDSKIEQNNLMVGGKKISGSSQRRGARAILHHGTLLYKADQERMLRYIRGDQIIRSGKGTSSSYREITSVSNHVDVTMDEVYRAVKGSLLQGKEIYTRKWSEEELHTGRDLIVSRYGNDQWNTKM